MTRTFERIVVGGLLSLACGLTGVAAAQTPAAQKPQITVARAAPIVSVEGKDNYDAYCAVCHGAEAKGNGPAAPAMKVPVPDLTSIAKRNKGKFPAMAVNDIIRGSGRTATPAHGVETMPIWGDVFRAEDNARLALRIGNLVTYLESIQVK